MTGTTSLRKDRLSIVFDSAIVLIFAIFLWAPWQQIADAGSSAATMAWLALPMVLARHGLHLVSATVSVTISTLLAAGLGALISIAARMRGSAALWAVGAWLFGCSVAILMPLWITVGFLGALLLIVALRARFVVMRPATALIAVLSELWPLGYAAGFAALAWRYNPQLLLKVLLIAFGVSLIARAAIPSRENGTATENAGSQQLRSPRDADSGRTMNKEGNTVTRSRFEIEEGGEVAYLEFETDSQGWMTIWHTEVPSTIRGQGVASELAQTAFEYAKQNNLRVDVICPLAANFLSKHPEYDSTVGRKADG